tara:strand:- start:977 stop:1156 length:180 start_codon:yes stop_codon:yes gene_type:complete
MDREREGPVVVVGEVEGKDGDDVDEADPGGIYASPISPPLPNESPSESFALLLFVVGFL